MGTLLASVLPARQMTPGELTRQARAWIADDPSPADRAELADLLAVAGQPGPAGQAALAELADRFAGRLEFGTAGLRGAMGAGPNRMNRAVVRAATMGLARWLHERWPAAAQAGVVLGWDARHRSAEFAEEAAAVLTGAGIPVHLLPGRSPTPLLAFAVRYLSAGAGVMITASHNPPADNGYKLYLGDGAQIVPPVDAQIEAAIREVGPLSGATAGPAGRPARHPARPRDRRGLPGGHPARRAGRRAGPRSAARLHAAAWGGGQPDAAGHRAGRVPGAARGGGPGAARSRLPAPCPSPTRRNPGALDLALAEAARLGADLVLASDPDGDRLAVAVPDPATGGGWRTLTGDQVGSLLGAFLLDVTAGDPDPERRLVASTVVSSQLLAGIAAAAGVQYKETLTGFKWIVRAADDQPGSRLRVRVRGGAGLRGR